MRQKIIKHLHSGVILAAIMVFVWIAADHGYQYHYMRHVSVIDNHADCENTEYVAYFAASDVYVPIYKCNGLNDLPEGPNYKHQ